MLKLDASSVGLPEFLAEQATSDAERVELAELIAPLGALGTLQADASSLARGRARLLAAVSDSSERFAPLFGRLTQFFDLGVEALRAQLDRASLASEWEPGPLPWVSLFHLSAGPALAGLDTGLVRLKKGMPFPPHRHLGNERVMILEGGYWDDAGRFYGPGDVHLMTAGTEHSLQMNPEKDVLLAVILAAEIQVIGAPG